MSAPPEADSRDDSSLPSSKGPSGDIEPRVGVLAVVWSRRGVLLVHRRNPPQAGHWGFPGGHVNAGETLRAAAQRELTEETGVQGAPGAPFTAVDVIDRDAAGTLRHHFALVAVRLEYRAGTPTPGDDAADAGWFRPEALPSPLCTDVADLLAASRPD